METTWVRSVYLYAVCAFAVLLFVVGAISSVVSASAVISPGLGQRDNIDRIGIGVANIATDIVDIVAGQNPEDARSLREFCEEVFADDVQGCIAENDPTAQLAPVIDGIGKVKGELESQIRQNAIAGLIKGLLMVVVGWLLWRYHAHHTELYRDGLTRRRSVTPALAVETTSAPEGPASAALPHEPPPAGPTSSAN